MGNRIIRRWGVPVLLAMDLMIARAEPPQPPAAPAAESPRPNPIDEINRFPLPPGYVKPQGKDIDLPNAFRLAGVENPEIFLARMRVVEAVAVRQLAVAKFLPNINAGGNYDAHYGEVQQSSGNIIKTNRESLYLGLGANAVAAGTVAIPGIQWWGNPSDVIYGSLVTKQLVRAAEADNLAVRNQILLRVADAYVELLRGEGRLVIALRNRADTARVAKLTRAYAQTGQGTAADADRANTDLSIRDTQLLQAQNDVLVASARLAELLNLDPSLRLHATDGWVVPAPIVPGPIPLPELLTIGLMQRPELEARRAEIAAALLELHRTKVLPFSPMVMLGYSYGSFGGGSNVSSMSPPLGQNKTRFGDFQGREDFDTILYWTAQNLGVGNIARIRSARSNFASANLQQLITLNLVRNQVATAYADTLARYAQIEVAEMSMRSSDEAFTEDLARIRGAQGRPIEVLDSVRLLSDARYTYLNAICDFNRAEFALYVALGQPPADKLARPVPANLVPPPVHHNPPDCLPAAPVAAKSLPHQGGNEPRP